jgi:gliding motility-associated-like protein
VTATDDVTHCVSPPASTQVIDIRVLPAFTIDSTPSYCTDTGRPKGNGSFTLTSQADVAYAEIKWTLAGDTTNVQGMGPYVNELWPGDYHVLVTTYEGCERSENASIITEIKPYNLVSTNNDGQNDAFIIDCISNYPSNNVKIFNRNGTMVYEADGYDNTTKFFRGVGEKGVYLSDKELPEGTYFYIIDKRNGTKPKSGFIELVR